MLAFSINKKSRRAARPESAERRIGYAVDRRPKVRKSFQFQDVLRFADDQAEREMMNPRPSPQFRRFFAQFAQPRPVTPVAQERMDQVSQSGAKLSMTVIGIRV